MSSHDVIETEPKAAAERAHAPPWLFGITSIPYGVVGSFCGVTMPFLARRAGIDMDSIGWFGLAVMIPPMLQFLYAPIIDIGPKRRVWLVIVSLLGALCLAGAMLMPLPDKIGPFMALTVAGQLISGLVGSCNGGIISASMPDNLRGRTSGWMNTGNLAMGAAGAMALLWMQSRVSPKMLALAVIVMMVGPALAALWIPEPDREPRSLSAVFGDTVRDVWSVVRTRKGFTGFLLCASPVGTAALINYFSALAPDFHADDKVVVFVNGPGGAMVTALGAFGGGWLCDRMNRRNAYLISGGLTAAVGLVMRQGSFSPTAYVVGVTVYLLVAGFCYAAFSAFVFEVVGDAVGRAAATQYALFTAAGNLGIAYVGKIDTHYHKAFGVRGVLLADAAQNVVGIVALLALSAWLLRRTPTHAAAATAN